MSAKIFMVWHNRVWVVEVPDNCNPWEYAREKLGVEDDEITPWGEFRMENGVACFNYEMGYSEAHVWNESAIRKNKLAKRLKLHKTVLDYAENLIKKGDMKKFDAVFGDKEITGRSNEELQAIIDNHIKN